MNKELLSPAGTKEAFYAAISNGCNAIYLGLDKFSARAYANNFTIDNLKELLVFAHLRNVKIYITINTIVYDNELEEVYKTIDELAHIGVDAIIVQDLAVLNYIANHYKSIKAHASTQMGIDDKYGASIVKKLGASRVVLARETPLNVIRDIKDNVDIELENFIHGALCVGYSGNCLMSSMMGERSGNRGRCAGCCRKFYKLINLDKDKELAKGYLLSMKDLNTSDYLSKMQMIDSYKIEGRMKEPNYVANVTIYYRSLLDNKNIDKELINKVFNRTYTKGFINNETSEEITNIERPNNYGYEIGYIERISKNKVFIRLFKELNKGDQIRVESSNKFDEISIPILKMYDSSFKVVNSMSKLAIIDYDKHLIIGARVYKTKDVKSIDLANKSLENKEYNKLEIDMEFTGLLNRPLFLKVQYDNYKIFVKSEYIVEESMSASTTETNIENQLNKLNDTPYKIRHLDINIDDGIFIPLKLINELRREAIEKLNSARLDKKVAYNEPKEIIPLEFSMLSPSITVEVSNDEQYEAAKECGIKHIYYKNIVRRNNANYIDSNEEILVGGLGSLEYYKDKNIVTDYSFNAVNFESIALLSSLGAKRITLSEEISKDNINTLIENYLSKYHTHPNLELIVYGRSKLMHSRYCPLKRLGYCGTCKTTKYVLKDEYASFPLTFNDDCTVNIYNSKILNIMDEIDYIKGINFYRLRFTTETKEEVKEIINMFKTKLEYCILTNSFDKEKHTRGHFYKNPL